VIWYGGGKLAPDLTLPKLRARWAGAAGHDAASGAGLPGPAARALLRNMVTNAADGARDEAGFFAALREAGVQVRLRFSESDPGQVTGYAVTLPSHTGPGGALAWYGGGRLAAGLTLPHLRDRWNQPRSTSSEHPGAFRFTAAERDAIYAHAARQAASAAEHIRRGAHSDPSAAADAAWAAAGTLHVAARALRNPALRCAADTYDRAARAPHGRVPRRSGEGDRLRATARLIALAGDITGDSTLTAIALVANLVALAAAAELRQAQQHAAQSAAAHAAARHLHTAMAQARPRPPRPARGEAPRRGAAARAARHARADFLVMLGQSVPMPAGQGSDRGSGRPLPPRCAGPARR